MSENAYENERTNVHQMCAGARDYAIGYCTAGDHRKSTVFGVTGSFHMKMFAAFATRRRPSPFA